MPAMTKCPFCGFDGAHGFTGCGPGIMHFHHTKGRGTNPECGGFYLGHEDKAFRTRLEALEARVLPEAERSSLESDRVWAQATRADCAGKWRLAKRLFEQWRSLAIGGQ